MLKNKSSVKKRFIFSKNIIKRSQAFKRHILTKKRTKLKRHLRKIIKVNKSNIKSLKNMMPYK